MQYFERTHATTATILTPMTPISKSLLAQVKVAPDQVEFSGQPTDFIDLNDPQIDIHCIMYGDRVAGMFRIDRNFYIEHPFADPDTPGLRTFIVDHSLQGRGIATATARLLRDYLRDQYKEAVAVYLTVNLRNHIARKIYLAGGFMDTDKHWLGGAVGPQNILKLLLKP